MDDDIFDQDFEDRMELTQLRAGHVLDERNVAAIKALFDELEEEGERGNGMFEAGLKSGREEAGSASLVKLLEEREALRGELAIEKSMGRFWKKLLRQRAALQQEPAAK